MVVQWTAVTGMICVETEQLDKDTVADLFRGEGLGMLPNGVQRQNKHNILKEHPSYQVGILILQLLAREQFTSPVDKENTLVKIRNLEVSTYIQ
jgi:hypothetical protein